MEYMFIYIYTHADVCVRACAKTHVCTNQFLAILQQKILSSLIRVYMKYARCLGPHLESHITGLNCDARKERYTFRSIV